jgi:ADP-ribose pyrophosphatase YjhB (NUDIX family)
MKHSCVFSKNLCNTYLMETEQLQRTAGGIVIGDGGMIVLVMSTNSQSWLFPKGHVEDGETDEDAARREIAEETGLHDLEYIDDLGEFNRPGFTLEAGAHGEKLIRMFLFAAPSDAELAPTMEITNAKWFPYREVAGVLGTPHVEWFLKDRAWFATVFDRVREAIQRD